MITVTSNIREVLSWSDRLSAQYRFAVASALTETARKVAQQLPQRAQQDLDKPTPFTLKGFFSQGATKADLTATVGVKDQQARYLKWQVEGGVRQPARKALKLPGDVALDVYGNIPRRTIGQLIARAQAGKRATAKQGKRIGVSSKVDLMYGDPADGRPAGIYKRVQAGGRERLVPVILFPRRAARYEKRFDFHGEARRIVGREFEGALRRAWARAQATAR